LLPSLIDRTRTLVVDAFNNLGSTKSCKMSLATYSGARSQAASVGLSGTVADVTTMTLGTGN
jgi:hypothetical protein